MFPLFSKLSTRHTKHFTPPSCKLPSSAIEKLLVWNTLERERDRSPDLTQPYGVCTSPPGISLLLHPTSLTRSYSLSLFPSPQAFSSSLEQYIPRPRYQFTRAPDSTSSGFRSNAIYLHENGEDVIADKDTCSSVTRGLVGLTWVPAVGYEER